MIRATDLRLLPPDHLGVFEPALAEPPAGDRGGCAAITGFGEREIDEPVLFESRTQYHVEKSALPACVNLWDSGERFGDASVRSHHAQSPSTFSDKHPFVR